MMEIELDSYLVPLDVVSKKSRAARLGRMGEDVVADIFRDHGFDVDHLGTPAPFDLMATRDQDQFAVEVKTVLSDKSWANLGKHTKYLKRKFLADRDAKPMVVCLKLKDQNHRTTTFLVGYRMGVKNAMFPWVKDFADFLDGDDGC